MKASKLTLALAILIGTASAQQRTVFLGTHTGSDGHKYTAFETYNLGDDSGGKLYYIQVDSNPYVPYWSAHYTQNLSTQNNADYKAGQQGFPWAPAMSGIPLNYGTTATPGSSDWNNFSEDTYYDYGIAYCNPYCGF